MLLRGSSASTLYGLMLSWEGTGSHSGRVCNSELFRGAGGKPCLRISVMGVFPLLEDFQGSRDNVEFMRGMTRRGSFLSPDSITSRAQFPASESRRRMVRLRKGAADPERGPSCRSDDDQDEAGC